VESLELGERGALAAAASPEPVGNAAVVLAFTLAVFHCHFGSDLGWVSPTLTGVLHAAAA
jgi:hypothetical protein